MSEKLLINEDKSNNFEIKSNNLPSVLTNEEKVSVKGKQIDEIAKLICVYPQCIYYNIIGECANKECQFVDKADHLYEAGYRKQSEGEWKYQFTLDGDRFYECSVCGRQVVINCLCNKKRNASEFYPYCNCGAKMKGGE